MQKWEYKVINSYPSEEELQYLGAMGWELVCFDMNNRAYFKRPKS